MIPFTTNPTNKPARKVAPFTPSQRLRTAIRQLWDLGVSPLTSERYYEERIAEFEDIIYKERMQITMPKEEI